jgi:WD40 repeat protein
VDTRDCMTRFVTRSLATWLTGQAGELALLLHDLQRDFIYKRREKGLPGLNLRLLEAWATLPKLPDTYAWRWVVYHMVQAGHKDDLRQLLLTFGYLQGKLLATDANALIADYDQLASADEELRLIQSALRLSAHVLVHDKWQLAGQLIGRLTGIGRAGIEDVLRQAAARNARPQLQPLTRSLTAPGGPLIRTVEGHRDAINAVAVTPDGRRAVSGSIDRTLRLWDLETGQTLRMLEGHTDSVRAVAVTPDGRHALSGSEDRTLRLWDLGTGQTLRTLAGHNRAIRAVAVMPDGRRAVSSSLDRTLRLWDLEAGQTIRTFKGHTGSVRAVAVTQDGRRILSGSQDRTLRLWDLGTGQTICTLKGHTDGVRAVAVTSMDVVLFQAQMTERCDSGT